MMKLIKYPEKAYWKGLLRRPVFDAASLESAVREILVEVKATGDMALKKYSRQFDLVDPESLNVSEKEFAEADSAVSKELKDAIQLAKTNIEKFHSAQRIEKNVIETANGVFCWRKQVAIEKVGLYIPGGSAPLFSTVLMLGIPAMIAGCREIVLCTPPDRTGKVNPVVLYTAALLGIRSVFKVGGAQAIAAMAYGTESVPQVYKIFGPGNQYVTAAKQMVSREGVAIDMPAGPSELAVLADESCVPEFVAADLLSQAEHGRDSQVILVSDSESVIQKVNEAIQVQLKVLPRMEITSEALRNSKAFLVISKQEGISLLNAYAPEHLILACENDEEWGERVVNAGSVFLGNYSCESAGDYASGTNHTLPTNGNAMAYSGISLDSFVKMITFQKLTAGGINRIGNAVELMAAAEGLQAHKNAVTIRLKK